MKRILFTLLVLASCIFTSLYAEKEYEVPTQPDALYFIRTDEVPSSGLLIITNNETFMWYPARIEFMFTSGSSITNTYTISHVSKYSKIQGITSRVVTNDLGNLDTNYLHAVTNRLDVYNTNGIVAVTSITNLNYAATTGLDGIYLQRGDMLRYTVSDTNSMKVRTIGKR
jgi:hypothetical protein